MATEKFKALVHYLIHQCRDAPSRLGAVRLNKALWYSDVLAYKVTGMPITGEQYVKRQMGPVPHSILPTLRSLESDGSIVIKEPEFQYDTRKFLALTHPPSDILSDAEREIASYVLDAVCDVSANKISEISHDLVWEAAQMGEVIPYAATLAATEGEITIDVLAWADSIVAEQTKAA